DKPGLMIQKIGALWSRQQTDVREDLTGKTGGAWMLWRYWKSLKKNLSPTPQKFISPDTPWEAMAPGIWAQLTPTNGRLSDLVQGTLLCLTMALPMDKFPIVAGWPRKKHCCRRATLAT